MITFYSGGYEALELFPEMALDAEAYVTLHDGMQALSRRARNRESVRFPLEKHTEYTLRLDGAQPGLMYLSGREALLDTGVGFLREDGSVQTAAAGMSCHFTPFAGSMHGLGSLCFYRGYYHMFYLYNPFSARWDNQYLGHAVSRDLLHWKHLPVLFAPMPEMQLARHRTGGVYAGSAVVLEDKVRLYFTRRVYARKSGEILREYPMYAESRDMLHFSEEMPVMADLPAADAGPAFRDPRATGMADGRYMMVGSTHRGRAAMLLYREKGLEWEYLRPVLKEETGCMEYPDFFPIGRSYAAIAALPACGNAAYWYTGSFQDGHFRVRKRGRLDFGGDFYAPQTLLTDGRRILFGCVRKGDGQGSCMTLPREVFTRGGRLYAKPAKEVYALCGEAVYMGRGETVTLTLEHTAFMVQLRLLAASDFTLMTGSILLHCRDGVCMLEAADDRVFSAETSPVRSLTVFADTRAAEVFINDGEAVAAVSFAGCTHFHAAFSAPDAVESLAVFPMALHPDTDAPDDLPPGETFEF